ncbi:unnamed protein product [Nezara viridula]|uniref:Uncharacterized protein n=1 Tax=Nezara viridula TaxID=85310 RepID=A0A9P0EDQ4_NEZVI|nr:unnamed protein product [Nezara viridula]
MVIETFQLQDSVRCIYPNAIPPKCYHKYRLSQLVSKRDVSVMPEGSAAGKYRRERREPGLGAGVSPQPAPHEASRVLPVDYNRLFVSEVSG